MSQPRYRFRYNRLDFVENIEKYQLGGFHPVTLGATFADGRYRVLHKLGFGGSATVWLARDLQPQASNGESLVALKILSAEESSRPLDQIAAFAVPQQLHMLNLSAEQSSARAHIQIIKDHFFVTGANGQHLCLVSQFAGPSIQSMAECPGRTSGSQRLRGDLARKVAKQVVDVVDLMHTAGFVHGDLQTANILFPLTGQVQTWSDPEVYSHFGAPRTDEIITLDGSPVGPHAPSQVVESIATTRLSASSPLQEDIMIIDFGQSFAIAHPPPDYAPAAPIHYFPPESYFEKRFCSASDVWALGCTIFEIRAGFPLIESRFGGHILMQIVQTLGRLPDPWWDTWEYRSIWFEDSGAPKDVQGALIPAIASSLREKLAWIGTQDDAPRVEQGPMFERTGTTLESEEVDLLTNLLEGMLKYRPEERMTISEVVRHPWFAYQSVQS